MPVMKREKKFEDIVKDVLKLPPPLKIKKSKKQKEMDKSIFNIKGDHWRSM